MSECRPGVPSGLRKRSLSPSLSLRMRHRGSSTEFNAPGPSIRAGVLHGRVCHPNLHGPAPPSQVAWAYLQQVIIHPGWSTPSKVLNFVGLEVEGSGRIVESLIEGNSISRPPKGCKKWNSPNMNPLLHSRGKCGIINRGVHFLDPLGGLGRCFRLISKKPAESSPSDMTTDAIISPYEL